MFDRRFLAFSFLLVLLGCGGSDGDNNETNNNSNSNVKNISINAQDLLTFSKGNKQHTVDLREKVIAEDGQNLIIRDIEKLDKNCSIINKNGLTFDIYTNDNSVCRFKYSVEPSSSYYQGNAEAVVQVVSTSDAEKGEYLPPVSKTVHESGKITLDSSDLLIEAGFEIDPNSILLIGDTENDDIGSIESVDKRSIVYQAPIGTTGTVRIFYSEKDIINNIVRPGIIYIAIGQEGNSNPIARNNSLDDKYITDKIIDNIDISSFISDSDGDDLQLIYLTSVLGTVEITSDKTFKYFINGVGNESIVYIVSDHNGGYGIGTLSFYVKAYRNIIDNNQNLMFLPPLVFSDLSNNAIMSGSFYEDGITGIPGLYPIFNKSLSVSYCETKGMKLATLSQLKEMRKNVLEDKPIFLSDYEWSSGLPFLTLDNTSISLDTGIENNSVNLGYFSCVKDLTNNSWDFIQPYYGAKLDTDTTVFLVSKSGDGIVFYPENDYDLSSTISEFKVNGIDSIDLVKDYVNVTIKKNIVRVDRKKIDNSILNLTLLISDVNNKASTTLIFGLSKCSSEFSSPELANSFLCVNTVNNKSEKFSLAISNDILDANNVPKLSSRPVIGLGYTKFYNIDWSVATYDERKMWLDNLKKMCIIMNQLKIDGRDNWDVGANNIPEDEIQPLFQLNDDDYALARDYTLWLAKQNGSSSDPSSYGQGYLPLEPNFDFYVNQVRDYAGFKSQKTSAMTFPSCYSKN
ncbi:TPA: Ig-like domain-containing protein [Photobacterium damselae]